MGLTAVCQVDGMIMAIHGDKGLYFLSFLRGAIMAWLRGSGALCAGEIKNLF
jgi:hypothetical protein